MRLLLCYVEISVGSNLVRFEFRFCFGGSVGSRFGFLGHTRGSVGSRFGFDGNIAHFLPSYLVRFEVRFGF